MDEIEELTELEQEHPLELETGPETEPERHPADTLNDGDPHKFFLLIPAFFLHTFIAAIVAPIGVTLASLFLDMRPSYGRYFWPGFIMEFVFAGLMGYAWAKWLDRWLFRTSRVVWIIPTLWLLLRVFSYHSDPFSPETRLQHFAGRVDSLTALNDQLYVAIPFVCAVGYALGAKLRRSRGDVLREKLEAFTAKR